MKVVGRPEKTFIIPTRTLFDLKYDSLEKKFKRKCRIVARGDIQKIFLGKKTKFSAPVASHVGLKLLLIYSFNCETLVQLDVKTAFLYGRLPQGKYFELPIGHPSKRGKENVWYSECALYGLLEGANAWYFTICDKLTKMGFTPLVCEPCIFSKTIEQNDIKVLIYVDDILVTGTVRLVEWVKRELEKDFKIKSTEDIEKYIGLNLFQLKEEDCIEINHTTKIKDTVLKWELEKAKGVEFPISITTDIEEEVLEDKKIYQSVVGSLNYITGGSRPDAMFATNYFARRVQKASKRLLKLAKNTLVYLRDTAERKIKLYKLLEKGNRLVMYVDASFATETKRRSVYGFLIYLNNSLIHYRSKTLPLIVLSSTEAEYVALCKGVQDLKWIKNILKELKMSVMDTIVYCDSQPAIKMVESPVLNGRTKHVDLKLQYIREAASRGEFKLEYIESKENLADVLTKAVRGRQFTYLVNEIFNPGNCKVREGANSK